jgi:hypothetical protein
MSIDKPKFPTEFVELPSKGLLYPEDNPLSSGKVEIKYMTAREEDILTNTSYISDGTVLDKLLQSLIVSKDIDYNDLIIGDKNALLISARILGYGNDYDFMWMGEQVKADLSQMDNKKIDESIFEKGKNEFSYTFPTSGTTITFKYLNHADEIAVNKEIKGLQKLNKDVNPLISTRIKRMIISVDGNEDKKEIREFVDNYLLARDSRAFRNHIRDTQPDVNLTVSVETRDGEEDVNIPIGIRFFWPDADL